MANSWFQFKQFKVNQDRCAMKISTDAVMLGALVEMNPGAKVLEIGAGTGVISLMLAQRFDHSRITAVEIDEDAAVQCADNFSESPFRERLHVDQLPVQDLKTSEKFDLIVSNPPYFPDHLKPNASARQKALHTDTLSFSELVASVVDHLHPEGDFWVILPPRQMEDFTFMAKSQGINAWKKITLADRPGKPIHRVISAFSFINKPLEQEQLILKTEKASHSQEYRNLLTEFFLDF